MEKKEKDKEVAKAQSCLPTQRAIIKKTEKRRRIRCSSSDPVSYFISMQKLVAQKLKALLPSNNIFCPFPSNSDISASPNDDSVPIHFHCLSITPIFDIVIIKDLGIPVRNKPS